MALYNSKQDVFLLCVLSTHVSTYGLRDEPNGVLVFRGMRNDHVTRSAQADKFDDGKIEICNCTQFR